MDSSIWVAVRQISLLADKLVQLRITNRDPAFVRFCEQRYAIDQPTRQHVAFGKYVSGIRLFPMMFPSSFSNSAFDVISGRLIDPSVASSSLPILDVVSDRFLGRIPENCAPR
jgi:hypothetical protein